MFYKGWVPTVNGRLSFKLIGDTRYPCEPEYVNSADDRHLYIAICQSRQLSDVLFEPILGPLLGYSGDFDCVFVGRSRRAPSSPDSKMIGKVFLFHRKAYKATGAKSIFRGGVRSMRSFDPGAANPGLKTCYLKISKQLSRLSDVSVNVVLNRDGIVTLSKITWNNHSLRANTQAHAENIAFDLDHGIADQIFFFIRDLTHQHQHHGNDADTITTTQRQSKPDDMGWCLEIMYSLYYHIITIKRQENPTEHVRALGILAYLQSFKSIIKRRAALTGSSLSIPEFDDSSTKESIKATKDYIDLRISEQKRNSDSRKSVILWFVATAFTVINFTSGFADKNIQTSPSILATANFLKSNSYILPMLALVALIYSLSNLVVTPRYDFKRDVVRLSFINRPLSVILCGGAGALFLILGAIYFFGLFGL